MIRVIIALGLFVYSAWAGEPQSQSASVVNYEIVKDKSVVEFTAHGKLFGNIFDVSGNFRDWQLQVSGEAKHATHANVKLMVQTKSIDTGIIRRDHHLRGEDFLSVRVYPQAVFQVKNIEDKGKGDFVLKGDLSLHGQTKELVIPVKLSTEIIEKEKYQIVTGNTVLSLKDYGIVYISSILPSVEDNVEVHFKFVGKAVVTSE